MRINPNGKVSELLRNVPIPKMFHAVQKFDRTHIDPRDIAETVEREMSRPEISVKIVPGMSVAVAVGSRGIRNIDRIVRAVVDGIKSRGAVPFIVPAMGSHGGATAEGQKALLANYRITRETMGCEIRSSMEAVLLGTSSRGRQVYMDKNAASADGIIPVCRVKPHNAFRGKYESGICKMLTVGLGKQQGASIVHSDGMDVIAENIESMAQVVLERAPMLFAVACVENAYDETYAVEAVRREDVLAREPELLREAFRRMPSLLVGKADVLIVDEIGKEFSGTGVDPNITGTFSTPYATGGLEVQRTCFLNLTKESAGNALGVGLASAVTERIFNAIDPDKMYANCITSTVLKSAMIPCVVANDREAIRLCIRTCNKIDQNRPDVVRIANSLHIGTIMLSESYYEDVRAGRWPGLTAVDEPAELEFDGEGNLTDTIEQ
ncbi:MAG: DUF2088 domain-containing protein [Firmicutes bacterium]|nr:DUF2088 domain-containing protein [Bacillota bacterium]